MSARSLALPQLASGEMDVIDELVVEETARSSRKSQSLVAVGDSKWSGSSKDEERPVTYTTKDLDEPEKFDDMSYARIGLILFRYVRSRIIARYGIYLIWLVWDCALFYML